MKHRRIKLISNRAQWKNLRGSVRADLQHSRWVGHKRGSINKEKKKKQREYIMQYVICEIT